MKSVFIIATFLSLSFMAQAAVSGPCTVCADVKKITQVYEEDEAKGYEQYNDYLGQVTEKLSADKALLSEEMKSLLSATVLMLKSDAHGELPDYLVAVEDAHPKEFAEALKELPKDQREALKKEMKFSRDFMKEGEEGPTTSKLPENKGR